MLHKVVDLVNMLFAQPALSMQKTLHHFFPLTKLLLKFLNKLQGRSGVFRKEIFKPRKKLAFGVGKAQAVSGDMFAHMKYDGSNAVPSGIAFRPQHLIREVFQHRPQLQKIEIFHSKKRNFQKCFLKTGKLHDTIPLFITFYQGPSSRFIFRS
ncbi:hypothetical protein D1872_262110 [compost metagenome]